MAHRLFLPLLAAASLAASPAAAKNLGCTQFMDAYNAAAGEYRQTFSRGLTVGRSAEEGHDYFDASGGDVDVSVVCRGDRFVRLEVRAASPVPARVESRFTRLQQAGVQVAVGGDRGRAGGVVRSLTREADEFLRGSRERGDHYVAGKVERHMSGGIDLGMIATETDRTFIVVNY